MNLYNLYGKKKKTHNSASSYKTLSLCNSVTLSLKNYNETPLFQGIKSF